MCIFSAAESGPLVGSRDVDAVPGRLVDEPAADRPYIAPRFVSDVGGGEWALVFFAGRLHHAFQRVPALVESAVGPALMEVELNESALGLHLDPDAPARFADVVLDAVSTVAS